MSTIGSRITLVRGDKSQAAFARKIGFHKNTLGNYERGSRKPDADFLVAMAKIGVNTNWLLTGEGPRYLAGEEKEAHELMVRDVVANDREAGVQRDTSFQSVSERMREVLLTTEWTIDKMSISLTAAQRAELNSMILNLYLENDNEPDTDVISRLARSFNENSSAS